METDVGQWSALTLTTHYAVADDGEQQSARVWVHPSALWLYAPALDWQGFTTPRIRVTYTAGYGATPSSVPYALRQAVLQGVAHLYENREAAGAIPDTLLPASYRVFAL
jgi:uncharacterized phiE125 gp8 family phage protein